MLVVRALKIGKIADGGMPPTYETVHYGVPKLYESILLDNSYCP
jgi:hypothetical protein